MFGRIYLHFDRDVLFFFFFSELNYGFISYCIQMFGSILIIPICFLFFMSVFTLFFIFIGLLSLLFCVLFAFCIGSYLCVLISVHLILYFQKVLVNIVECRCFVRRWYYLDDLHKMAQKLRTSASRDWAIIRLCTELVSGRFVTWAGICTYPITNLFLSCAQRWLLVKKKKKEIKIFFQHAWSVMKARTILMSK